MKKVIVFVILLLMLLSENTYAQGAKQVTIGNKVSQKDYSIEIDSLKATVARLKEMMPVMQSTIADAKTKISEVKETDEKNHTNFLHTWEQIWGTGLVALAIFTAFFSFKFNLNKLLTKKVATAVDKEVSYLSKEFTEFRKHNTIRTETTKLILNAKNTMFPESFKKVMKLFEINCDTDKIDLNDFADVLTSDNINKIKNVDLLIIENQVSVNNWTIEIKGDPTDTVNETAKKNIETLINFCNCIEGKTAIMYYGPGKFPDDKIKDENRTLISYTNAPSQLYGNIMNLLKFKDEIQKTN